MMGSPNKGDHHVFLFNKKKVLTSILILNNIEFVLENQSQLKMALYLERGIT